jgi:hypothetical protein
MDVRKIVFRFTTAVRDLFVLQIAQTGSGIQPISNSLYSEPSSPEVRQPGAWIWFLTPYNAVFKSVCSCLLSSPLLTWPAPELFLFYALQLRTVFLLILHVYSLWSGLVELAAIFLFQIWELGSFRWPAAALCATGIFLLQCYSITWFSLYRLKFR